MIFVTLGSQDKQFKRLLKEVDRLKKMGIIKDKVVVQAGCTKLRTKNLIIFDYLSIDEFQEYVKNSDLIITHGGVGSILDALKSGKKVIAVPREPEYDEIANEHQKQIISEFAKRGYLLGCDSVSDLEQTLSKVNNFKMKKFISNNENFVNLVASFID